MPPMSQLDWLSSTTAMIVVFWSRATRDLLKSFGWGIAALHRLDAATKLPRPRRPPHSISRSRQHFVQSGARPVEFAPDSSLGNGFELPVPLLRKFCPVVNPDAGMITKALNVRSRRRPLPGAPPRLFGSRWDREILWGGRRGDGNFLAE